MGWYSIDITAFVKRLKFDFTMIIYIELNWRPHGNGQNQKKNKKNKRNGIIQFGGKFAFENRESSSSWIDFVVCFPPVDEEMFEMLSMDFNIVSLILICAPTSVMSPQKQKRKQPNKLPSSFVAHNGPTYFPLTQRILHKRRSPSGPTSAGKRGGRPHCTMWPRADFFPFNSYVCMPSNNKPLPR